MAAENGSSAKDKQQADTSGPRRTGVTLDLKAEAAPKPPEAAAGAAEPDATAAGGTGPEPDAQNRPEAEPTAAGDAPMTPVAASPEPSRGRSGVVALVIAAVIGGVVALALGYGLQATGVLPAPGATAANEARAETAALKDTVSGLDKRLTSIEAASAQAIADRALLDDLSRKVGVVDAFGQSLGDRLLKAEAAIAALKKDASGTGDMQQTLDSLSKRVTRLETTVPPPAANTITEMQQRLDALSKRVAGLETLVPSSSATASVPAAAGAATASTPPAANDQAARAAAIADLQKAAAGSEPFSSELDKVAGLGVDPATIASLKPLAEKGAPTRAGLIAEFPKVAEAILAAEPAAGADGGLLGRLEAFGRSLVKVRPAGSQSGGDTVAIVTRMRTAVDAGDLATALTERKALPADGQAASQSWAAAVADRLEIDRLAKTITTPPATGNTSG